MDLVGADPEVDAPQDLLLPLLGLDRDLQVLDVQHAHGASFLRGRSREQSWLQLLQGRCQF
jgi:hypothetical protein